MNESLENIAEERSNLISKKFDVGLNKTESDRLEYLTSRLRELVPRITVEDFERLDQLSERALDSLLDSEETLDDDLN